MGKADKRARKKQHRDLERSDRAAQLRRRRTLRLAGVALVLLAVAGMALASSLRNDGGRGGEGATPEAACKADAPPPANPKQYDSPPEMTIDRATDYRAVISTSCGEIEIDLLEDKAPVTVNNFVFLAREGFYDGLIWHRVQRDSVLQTGDPDGVNGSELDGPGYSIPDELPRRPREYVYGVVGMANAGPDTGGSQFFIVIHKNGPAGFPADYSIFGVVAESSYPTLEEIARKRVRGGMDPAEAVKPRIPIFIESIEIIEA